MDPHDVVLRSTAQGATFLSTLPSGFNLFALSRMCLGSVRLLSNISACKDFSMMPDVGKIPRNHGATKLTSGQGAVLVISSDGGRPGSLARRGDSDNAPCALQSVIQVSL